ncbi:MAG: TonB family protein [Moraxellaceae bacterium]|nr:TonB family protein [Moraxellaceae bacterium]
MSASAIYSLTSHGAFKAVRHSVAVAVIAVHAVVVVSLWQQAPAPAPVMAAPVMVSFVSAPVAEPLPQPPVVVAPETPVRVLATERASQASANAPVVTPAIPPVPADVVPADAAPAADVAVRAEAVAPPVAQTPPSFGAAYLNNPKPVYPMVSRRLAEKGVTRLRVLVSTEGRPQQVDIERSSGSARLDRAAQATVRDWKFVPAREGEKAVAGWVIVPINWNLEN